MNDTSKLAFPFIERAGDQGESINCDMTLREWYAGLAMQGLAAEQWAEGSTAELTAKDAIAYADALIAALARKEGE